MFDKKRVDPVSDVGKFIKYEATSNCILGHATGMRNRLWTPFMKPPLKTMPS